VKVARIPGVKVKLRTYLKRKRKDIRCGLWSGYPPCCVAFHTFVWEPLLTCTETLAEAINDNGEIETVQLNDGPFRFRGPGKLVNFLCNQLHKFEAWGQKVNPRGFEHFGRRACPLCVLVGAPITPRNCHHHVECKK